MTLREFRRVRGLTQAQMAELIGVRKTAISRYEQDRIPSPDVMRRIVEATDSAVQPNDFYEIGSAA